MYLWLVLAKAHLCALVLYLTLLIVILLGYIGYSAWYINETLHEKSGRKTDRIYETAKRKRPNRSRLNTSKYLK